MSREKVSRVMYLRLRRKGFSHSYAVSQVRNRYWSREIRESRV